MKQQEEKKGNILYLWYTLGQHSFRKIATLLSFYMYKLFRDKDKCELMKRQIIYFWNINSRSHTQDKKKIALIFLFDSHALSYFAHLYGSVDRISLLQMKKGITLFLTLGNMSPLLPHYLIITPNDWGRGHDIESFLKVGF